VEAGRAEAAAKHYERAKDSTKLYEAVQIKLGEQRRFVLWWDEQEKAKGAIQPGTNRGTTPSENADGVARAENFGLDRDTIHRWRKRLKDPKKFDATLESVHERCRRVCEADKGATEQKGASGTGENEWHTPEQHLAAARQVFGAVDLDPANGDQAQEDQAQEKVRAARAPTAFARWGESHCRRRPRRYVPSSPRRGGEVGTMLSFYELEPPPSVEDLRREPAADWLVTAAAAAPAACLGLG
jgi:hypothetical protein